MDILLVFYSQSCHCVHIKKKWNKHKPWRDHQYFLLPDLALSLIPFPSPREVYQIVLNRMPHLWLMQRALTSAEYLLIRLIMKSLWFYAMIKHTTVAEQTGTYFLLQTNTHWALPTTSGEPVLPYCFFLLLFRIFHWRNENKSTTNLQGKSAQILDVNLQLPVTKRAKDPAPVTHSIFLTGELFVQPSLFFVSSFLIAVRSF